MDVDHLVRRAADAYYETGSSVQPMEAGSGHVEQDGQHFIVLANGDQVLAVYLVIERNGYEMMRRLKQWPTALSVRH
jgi:hypothetical protein